MGSDSDLPIMQAAAQVLETFNYPFEISIVSAHRTPKLLYEFAETAYENNIGVIIAGAGGAAHLPGMVSSLTSIPVIGVPVKTSTLNGKDSLLSIVQMPRGVPVATVAINNSTNAALLALEIIAVHDSDLYLKLKEYKSEMENNVLNKRTKLLTLGYKDYLKNMNEGT